MNYKQTVSLPLKSVKNARELGGYKTSDGKSVKHGLLLRTGKLDKITNEDITILRDRYRLGYIVDFRMPMELAGADDPVIDGVGYHHLDVIDPSVFGSTNTDIDINSFDLIQVTELTIKSGMLNERMYIGFLESDSGKRAFSDFFTILLDTEPDRAVLWHCTSGKDRTGLAAMLLLSALGVDEKTVMEDFLLTNDYNAERIAATKRYLTDKNLEEDFIKKALLVFDSVDESFMSSAIAHLKKNYGSVEGYIINGLNINQNGLNILRNKYLDQRG